MRPETATAVQRRGDLPARLGWRWPTLPDRWFLAAVVLVSTLLRFPSLLIQPTSDEAGFTLVGRNWAPAADNMFGTYWVDRPPVLIAAYRWADALGGTYGPRILAALLGALLLVAIYLLARRLAGEATPARVATLVAAALLANTDFSAWAAKGELLGAPFVMLSCLASVAALHDKSVRRRAALAAAAGATAMLAVGFKQNLLGGFVFGAVLLSGSLMSRRLPRSDGLRLAGFAILGAAIPVAIIAAWIASTPAQFDSAWYQVFGFRADASRVLAASDSTAPDERARDLWRLFLVSGMALIVAVAVLTCRRWLRGHVVVSVALLAMTAVDVVGIVVGGSYWHAYLIPLIPDLALVAALVCTAGRPDRIVVRVTAAVIAVASVLALVRFTQQQLDDSRGPNPWETGRAIAAVAQPGDTVVSLYGSPDLVEASGLHSPYEHLWSLPMRTLDPDLTELRGILAGPDAPTWAVAVLSLDSWHLDADQRMTNLLDERYVLVPEPCGPPIWLLRGTDRAVPQLDCGS